MDETKKEILKVEIGSKRIVVHYSEVDGDTVGNYTVEYSIRNKGLHPDLRKALTVLNKYLANVFYLKEVHDMVQVESVELYDNKDEKCVILGGSIGLSSGNLAKLKTDKVRLEPKECPYGFDEHFKLDVGVFMNEVKEYCFNNKQAQLQMDFKEDKPAGKKKEKNKGEAGLKETTTTDNVNPAQTDMGF